MLLKTTVQKIENYETNKKVKWEFFNDLKYFEIIFNGDIVTTLDNRYFEIIKEINIYPNTITWYEDKQKYNSKENHNLTMMFSNSVYYTLGQPHYILHKRNIYNWFKFLLVVITKNYNPHK